MTPLCKRIFIAASASATCLSHNATSSAAGSSCEHRSTPAPTVETALVVWDPDTKLEHVIVAARFDHVHGHVAFFIPTPAKAAASEVHANMPRAFASLIQRYRDRSPSWEVPSLPGGLPRPWVTFGSIDAPTFSVQDLVGNGDQLNALLPPGPLANTASLRDWFAHYATRGGSIVALHGEAQGGAFTTPYLQISFSSQRPYYPYREPPRAADDVERGVVPGTTARVLRIYVLTTERVQMRIGGSVPSMAQAWLSLEPRHDELREAFGETLYAELELAPERRYWLTSFEDYHVVRPGDDDLQFEHLAAIPALGEPGTVGDRTGAGLVLEPIAPEPGTVLPTTSMDERREEKIEVPRGAPRIGKAARMGIVFGSMLGIAVAGWAMLAKHDRKGSDRWATKEKG